MPEVGGTVAALALVTMNKSYFGNLALMTALFRQDPCVYDWEDVHRTRRGAGTGLEMSVDCLPHGSHWSDSADVEMMIAALDAYGFGGGQ